MGTCKNGHERQYVYIAYIIFTWNIRRYEYQMSIYCFFSITVYQVLIIFNLYINSQYLVSGTWYIPGTWYCFPARNDVVIIFAARQPRAQQKCTLSAEQSTLTLWIHTISTICTCKSLWALMRNVAGTRTYLILMRNGRTMPPAKVTVMES